MSDREKEILKKLEEILGLHRMMESNIAVNHPEYWALKRELNAIRNP